MPTSSTHAISFITAIIIINNYLHADDWVTYQHDYQRTGRSEASFDPQKLKLSWSSPHDFGNPIISNGMVYASRTVNGGSWPQVEFAAFDLYTGQERWSNQVAWTANTPAILNGLFVTLDYFTHLRVFDANTGTLLTDTPLPTFSAEDGSSPVLFPGSANGHLNCYLISNNYLGKFDVSASSTTKLWQVPNSAGGQLTFGGTSIFNTTPGNFSATSLTDGTTNLFYQGPINGGSRRTGVYDATRNRYYADDVYSTDYNAITAWDYTDNAHLQFRWEVKNGPTNFSSLALGPDGDLYFVDATGHLRDYKPTGALNRSSSMIFQTAFTPVIQNGYIWVANANTTYALDLQTLLPVKTLPMAVSPLDGDITAGELYNEGIIVPGPDASGAFRGFDVYAVPEPTSLALLTLAAPALLRRRKFRTFG